MSTARSRRARPSTLGFTALEVVIVLGMVSLLALVLERTVAGTRNAERYLSASRRVTERGQQVTYELRKLVTASRRLLINDTEGRDYLAALDLSRDPLLPTARLPLPNELGILDRDQEGDPRTGNILFFVQESDATAAITDKITGAERFIDTYRFICIYPRLTDRFVVTGDNASPAIDLVVWRSVRYPSYAQIVGIEDATQRQNAVADLYSRHGLSIAWDADGPAGNSFYELDGLGTVSSVAHPDPEIEEDVVVSDRGRLVYANIQLAATGERFLRRSVFSADDPAEWTPGGFEVKIVGTSGARQVWMHLVVESQATRGEVAVQPCTVIASVRDL